MAKMIPAVMREHVQSNAEKKVFQLLQAMKDTDDWVVLHSVGISKHPTQIEGEADFVVLIPELGVFVLEVKGGGISYSDGVWNTTNRLGETNRIDPLRQAAQCMWALNHYIKNNPNNTGRLQDCIFGFGVVFPDSILSEQISLPDVSREQIADRDDMQNIKAYLLQLGNHWQQRYKIPSKAIVPSKQQHNQLVRILRPVFDARIRMPAYIRNFDREVISLTENQQVIFEGLLENERCLIRGYAGTGKTILAMNYANTLAKQEKCFALFCYNLRLANYLKDKVNTSAQSTCGSFTAYMEEIARSACPNQCDASIARDKDNFYRNELPKLFMDAFIDKDLVPVDVLVIDEAQDLLTPTYMQALDLILKGGLKGGSWCFFLDAEQQNIFHPEVQYDDVLEMLQKQSAHFTKFTLKDNCRNTPAIIQFVDRTFGMQTRYRHRDEQGTEVLVQFYKNRETMLQKVDELLKSLTSEGLRPEQITILSPNRFEQSSAAELTTCQVSDSTTTPEAVRFSTIASFKGLENHVIVLIEMEQLGWNVNQRLLYVGSTRAKSVLCIFVAEKTRQELKLIRRS